MSDELDYQKQLEAELEAWEDSLTTIPTLAEPAESPKGTGLSDEEIKFLLLRPLQTKSELQNWIKYFLQIDLPDTTVDPDSTSNPLEMVWKIYETAIHYDKLSESERHIKSMFYCARGSFKTMCACIVELLVMMHSGRNTVHIGIIESQAKNAYNLYFRPFLEKPFIKEYVRLNSILEKSELKDKDGNRVILQVIPLTLNKTSSPRAQLVVKDEVDKVKGEQVQAYENVHGMLTMTNDKKMSMEFDISSRDSAYGMIQEIIDNSEKTGCKVYHWNRIDITEKCPDSRSGTLPIPIWTKKDTLIAISQEDYEDLDREEKEDYEEQEGLEGCLKNCKMFGACRGFLKNQDSKSKWLKPVKETEMAILSAPSEEMAISQLLCRTPPKAGLVYGDFNVRNNMKTAGKMYEIWKGAPHKKGNKLSTEELIREFNKAKLPRYIGVDAGFHNPACILIFLDEKDNVYVVKEHMPNDVDSQELAQWLEDNWKKYYPTRVFVDPESPDCTRAVRKKGFNVSSRVDKARQLGIATVKGFIRVPTTRQTKIFVNTECMGIKWEFGHWAYKQGPDGKYTDDAEKKDDHAMDGIRYVLHTLFGKAMGNVAYREELKVVDIGDSKAYREAGVALNKEKISPHEVARQSGHVIRDNRDEFRTDKENEEKPKKRSTTGYDINDY